MAVWKDIVPKSIAKSIIQRNKKPKFTHFTLFKKHLTGQESNKINLIEIQTIHTFIYSTYII